MKTRRLCCMLLVMALMTPAAAIASQFDGMTNAQLIAMDDELADVMIARGLYAYISPSGGKYHTKPTCSSMKITMRVPVDDLEACGYEPCKRCYKKQKEE